ncbi:MAG: chorismate mutase [Anaerolineae bacterium]|nr:chorismate mutase [Gemmatimonadaceae bacterium]
MSQRYVRALRGATTVVSDEQSLVGIATAELVSELMARNGLHTEDIISAIFTVTADLTSENPARAARKLCGLDIPAICVREMAYADSIPRCIRLMLHVERNTLVPALTHVYLGEARVLRPDLD